MLKNPLPGFEAVSGEGKDVKAGIYCFYYDEETGDLTSASNYYTDSITSVLKISSDGKYLFSNDEERNRHGEKNAGGGVLSFSIDSKTGALSLLSDKSSFGASPAFIDIDKSGRLLFAANLGNPHQNYVKVLKNSDGDYIMSTAEEEGTISVMPINSDGIIGDPTDVTGYCDDRYQTHVNEYSHYHCVCVDPTNQYLIVCDTKDKIYIYRIDQDSNTLIPNEKFSITVEMMSEPRFVQFHPNGRFFYINNQHNSTVDAFSFDAGTGTVEQIAHIMTVKKSEDALKTWTSEMTMTPDGKYLYVASRGMGKIMRGLQCPPSSVSIIKIDEKTGMPELLDEVYVKAENPRGIGMSPDGHFLFVVSVDTNEIYRFTIDSVTGMLSEEKAVAEAVTPSSICFITLEIE